MVAILLFLLAFCVLSGIVSATINQSASGFLATPNITVSLSDETGIKANPNVTVAQPAVLTTHTTNTTGTITMTNGSHGITTGQRVDLYWSGGQCYGAVVGTVSGTTVPIASVSGGSNLPASATPITVAPTVSAPFPCTGDNVQGLTLSASLGGYFVFNDGSSDVFAQYVTQTDPGYLWFTGSGVTNPLAGATPTKVYMSTSSTLVSPVDMIASAMSH